MRKLALGLPAALLLCSSAAADDAFHQAGSVPAWWSIPFLLLLASIAFAPFLHKPLWDRFYAHIAIGLGLVTAAIYVSQLGAEGAEILARTALEYFKFIALVGSLFIVSGGILIDVSGGGSPRANTLLLAASLLLANVAGTTGASILLIRPFLRMNKGRMRPFHVVFFIFIVSNCAGALTPIGDPPLFLGYINGIPFEWTIVHCWAPWVFTNGLLLGIFYVLDARVTPAPAQSGPNTLLFAGWGSVACLAVVLLGVFVDRFIAVFVSAKLDAWPIGAVLMLAAAWAAHRQADPRILKHNGFHFGPVIEVALLFAGIFITMMPALAYLAAHAAGLGIRTPGGFYFGCGCLSSILDNAPAYLNFLSVARGLSGFPSTPEGMRQFSETCPQHLRAISLGAVFFGACTYIGNGPNFMVKAIAESAGAPAPGFFEYIWKYALPVLFPIFILVWLIFL